MTVPGLLLSGCFPTNLTVFIPFWAIVLAYRFALCTVCSWFDTVFVSQPEADKHIYLMYRLIIFIHLKI